MKCSILLEEISQTNIQQDLFWLPGMLYYLRFPLTRSDWCERRNNAMESIELVGQKANG